MEILLLFLLTHYILNFKTKQNNYLYCGLFGFIPHNKKSIANKEKIKILGILNTVRGTDSCGIYFNENLNHGIDAESNFIDYIGKNNININCMDNNIVLGHTRKSTNNSKNVLFAHPFYRKDNFEVLLAHNGYLTNEYILKEKFNLTSDLDSKIFADYFAKNGKDFEILKKYDGYAALSFSFLNEKNTIYLYKGESYETKMYKVLEERPLFLLNTKEGYYYSSLEYSLNVIMQDDDKLISLKTNTVYKISNGKIEEVESIKRVPYVKGVSITYPEVKRTLSNNSIFFPNLTRQTTEINDFSFKFNINGNYNLINDIYIPLDVYNTGNKRKICFSGFKYFISPKSYDYKEGSKKLNFYNSDIKEVHGTVILTGMSKSYINVNDKTIFEILNKPFTADLILDNKFIKSPDVIINNYEKTNIIPYSTDYHFVLHFHRGNLLNLNDKDTFIKFHKNYKKINNAKGTEYIKLISEYTVYPVCYDRNFSKNISEKDKVLYYKQEILKQPSVFQILGTSFIIGFDNNKIDILINDGLSYIDKRLFVYEHENTTFNLLRKDYYSNSIKEYVSFFNNVKISNDVTYKSSELTKIISDRYFNINNNNDNDENNDNEDDENNDKINTVVVHEYEDTDKYIVTNILEEVDLFYPKTCDFFNIEKGSVVFYRDKRKKVDNVIFSNEYILSIESKNIFDKDSIYHTNYDQSYTGEELLELIIQYYYLNNKRSTDVQNIKQLVVNTSKNFIDSNEFKEKLMLLNNFTTDEELSDYVSYVLYQLVSDEFEDLESEFSETDEVSEVIIDNSNDISILDYDNIENGDEIHINDESSLKKCLVLNKNKGKYMVYNYTNKKIQKISNIDFYNITKYNVDRKKEIIKKFMSNNKIKVSFFDNADFKLYENYTVSQIINNESCIIYINSKVFKVVSLNNVFTN
jgi:predicted glutamine amidotransferase